MKLLFERFFPYLFGVIAGILWVQTKLIFPESDTILSSTLSVSSIFVGFLATSKAILIGMNSQVIEDIRDSGYIKDLANYIGDAIWLNLIFCTINIVGYFVNQASQWFGICWIILAVMSLMAFVRVTHIMLQIFKHSHPKR